MDVVTHMHTHSTEKCLAESEAGKPDNEWKKLTIKWENLEQRALPQFVRLSDEINKANRSVHDYRIFMEFYPQYPFDPLLRKLTFPYH